MKTGRSSSTLELREPVHRQQYRVVYADTDTAGVVYYGSYLRLFEIGRTEFMRAILRLSYRSLELQGVHFPVSESYCRYKASAAYDDLLEIATSLGRVTRRTLCFNYEILRTEDSRLLARGFTGHAAVDDSGRLCELPDTLKAAIAGADPSG